VVTSMSVSGTWEAGYQLPELLSRFGVPGQIWVSGYSVYPNYSGPRPITLYLYYPDRNFEAHFTAPPTVPEGTAEDSIWQNCLGWGPNLSIMEQDENRDFDEVAVSLGTPQYPVLPVSEVYKDATDPICFKTQVELWHWGDATPSP
jgi:hypothetical protein